LRKEQRRLSRKQKGSQNWNWQRIAVARTHERVCDRRDNFQHKLSHRYVDSCDLIVTEKLDIRDMIENGHQARGIGDAAWNSFDHELACKAERAGKLFVQVDARGTRQECSRCGECVLKTLNDRWHDCPRCGLSRSRDHKLRSISFNEDRRGRGRNYLEPACGRRTAMPLGKEVHVQWMKREVLS